MYLDFLRVLGFYSSVEPTFVSWWRMCFLGGKILINTCMLWDLFLIESSLTRVSCRVLDIFILGFLEIT